LLGNYRQMCIIISLLKIHVILQCIVCNALEQRLNNRFFRDETQKGLNWYYRSFLFFSTCLLFGSLFCIDHPIAFNLLRFRNIEANFNHFERQIGLFLKWGLMPFLLCQKHLMRSPGRFFQRQFFFYIKGNSSRCLLFLLRYFLDKSVVIRIIENSFMGDLLLRPILITCIPCPIVFSHRFLHMPWQKDFVVLSGTFYFCWKIFLAA
jgi:hypothetical protein